MNGYLGQVMVFAGNFIPQNWSSCGGQLLQISQNGALYSVIGTTYGGDGTATFGLPELRGRTAVGEGQGPGLSNIQLGQQGGSETFTLTITELPAHTHSATFGSASAIATVRPSASSGRGTLTNEPTGNFPAQTDPKTNIYSNTPDTQMGQTDVIVNVSNVSMGIGLTGNSSSVLHRSPYLGMNWIICTGGLFPSRN